MSELGTPLDRTSSEPGARTRATAARRGGSLNPFPGLRPFREGEEHLFFGRESRTDAMVDKLAATRFLAVIGSSGSGKSSLVNCGLKVALRSGLMADAGTAWRIATCRPGGDPIAALARALAADGVLFDTFRPEGLPLEDIVETNLRMSRLGLADVVEQARLGDEENVLVVVDQFEELFRFRRSDDGSEPHRADHDEEAIAFVALLLEATRRRRHAIHVVLTMRSDFLGDCAALPGLAEAINDGQYLVPRMTREERRLAITGPLDVAGVEILPVLLTKLLNDVGDDPDQLSILQHALNRIRAVHLERDGGEGRLNLTHYSAVGSLANALDRHAETVWTELAGERERRIAETVFKALTDTSSDARGVRRPCDFGTLRALCDVPEAEVAAVVDAFRRPDRSFLMPPADEPLAPDTVVDISHESLMRTWRRLVAWAAEEAESARVYRRLLETARLHERGAAGLWRDPDLAHALAWRERDRPSPVRVARYGGDFDTAMGFLDESAEANEAARRARLEEEAHVRELERTRAVAVEQRARIEAQNRAEKVKRNMTLAVAVGVLASASLSYGVWSQRSLRKSAEEAERSLRVNTRRYLDIVGSQELKGRTVWELVGREIPFGTTPVSVVFRNLANRPVDVLKLNESGTEINLGATASERLTLDVDGERRVELFENDVWTVRSVPAGPVFAAGVVTGEYGTVTLEPIQAFDDAGEIRFGATLSDGVATGADVE